jgi:hypothetical protein
VHVEAWTAQSLWHFFERKIVAEGVSPDRKCNRNCTISACRQAHGRYHHDWDGFPCKRLHQLDQRYRKEYGMRIIENLEAIGQLGIRRFVETERERWTCRFCGGRSISITDVAHPAGRSGCNC